MQYGNNTMGSILFYFDLTAKKHVLNDLHTNDHKSWCIAGGKNITRTCHLSFYMRKICGTRLTVFVLDNRLLWQE